MNLILLGPPGAGKGTVSGQLAEVLKIPHISTGDIFRACMKAGTELGKLAESYISKGCLVPDEVTIQIVENRLKESDCANGFILDGFPRTIKQALKLDDFLKQNDRKIDRIINIVVSEEELYERLTNRLVCADCKLTYSLRAHPGIGSVCPACGGKLVQRDDDRREVIEQRLATYHTETEPLVAYYRKSRKLVNVRSEKTIEDTFENVLYALRIKGF